MRAVMIVVLAVSMTACGGGADGSAGGGSSSGGRSGSFCQKVQACNVLQGASVAECTGLVDQCLQSLLPGARQDWNANMNECLQMQSCANFINCWRTGPGC